MPGAVFLAGAHVELRTVEPEDVPFLHRWSNDPSMRRATGEQSIPLTLAEEEAYYRDAVADETLVLLLVCLDGEPIGSVELREIEREADVVELAYWLVPDARGRQLADEAVELVLEYAFDELGSHRVHAEAFEFNERSAELLDRLGFTEEGRLRENHITEGRRCDTLVFGLLDREWRDADVSPGPEPDRDES